VKDRCFLVYALDPAGVSAREANDALNRYIEDESRGLPVFHDHFTGRPHGGIAVLHVRDQAERALLDDPGPLAGWTVSVHALTFALTAVGFLAQTELTLAGYAHVSLADLEAAEADDPRYWWRR
jgi:hypothetical protein